MQNRERNIQIKFYVTAEEKEKILSRMSDVKINIMGAFLRKMALNGYCINVDMSDYKILASEINKIGNNINQIAKLANEYHIYDNDIKEIKEQLQKIWQLLRQNLSKLQCESR